jgi:hypothetical protein
MKRVLQVMKKGPETRPVMADSMMQVFKPESRILAESN